MCIMIVNEFDSWLKNVNKLIFKYGYRITGVIQLTTAPMNILRVGVIFQKKNQI